MSRIYFWTRHLFSITVAAMMDTNSVIDRLGGPGATAELCKITEDAVSKWAKNGIPPKHWATVVSATNAEISYEFLANLRRAKSEATAA